MTAKHALALGVGLLLLAGCRSPSANKMVINAPPGNAQIEVVNPGLQGEVEIVSGRALYEGEVMLGWVTVRSHVDEKRKLEYRWTFYDADGVAMSIGQGGNPWQPVWVNPLEEIQIEGRAPQPGATRAEFFVRYPFQQHQ